MRILVAGTGRLGAAILEPLLDSPHEVVGLILNGRRVKGRIRRYFETSLLFGALDAPVRVARRRRIPIYWLYAMTPETLAPLARSEPDLLITCGFGIILKRPVLELPAIGCVNVHSSLLPKHRGPMPFNWTILSGDDRAGVTFHITTETVDGGDILDQKSFPVTPRDTAMTIYRRCCELARQRILPVVSRIDSEGLIGTPQDASQASYDPPLTEKDMEIDWSRPVAEIERLVRAGTAYLPASFRYRGRCIQVERALGDTRPVSDAPGTVIAVEPQVQVATGMGTLTIVRAAQAQPVIWPWPNGLSRPRVGTRLD